MGKPTIYDLLAENVRAGMVEKYGKEHQTKLVRDSGIGTGSISRILGTEAAPRGNSTGLEVIEKVATGLGVPAWLLLFPNASGIMHKKSLHAFLEICDAWSKAGPNGRDIMVTAAALARVRDAAQASRGEAAVSTDAG